MKGVCRITVSQSAACTFNEILMSECPSRAIMCKNGLLKGLSVETILSEGNYQILIVNSNNVNEFGSCAN